MSPQEDMSQLQAQTSRLIEQARAVLAAADGSLAQAEPLLAELGLPADPARIQATIAREFTEEQVAEIQARIRMDMATLPGHPIAGAGLPAQSDTSQPVTGRPRLHRRIV